MQDSDSPAACRMLRNHEVANIHGFAVQGSLQDVFDPSGSQSGKNLHGGASQNFVHIFPGQPLHKRVEELIAEFGVIEDDPWAAPMMTAWLTSPRLSEYF